MVWASTVVIVAVLGSSSPVGGAAVVPAEEVDSSYSTGNPDWHCEMALQDNPYATVVASEYWEAPPSQGQLPPFLVHPVESPRRVGLAPPVL